MFLGSVFVVISLIVLAADAYSVRQLELTFLGLVFLLGGSVGVVRGFRTRRRMIARMRHEAGFCFQCGYNLTGNTSGACPECGVKIEEAPEAEAAPAKLTRRQIVWFIVKCVLVFPAWLMLGTVGPHGVGWVFVAFFAVVALWSIWNQVKEIRKTPRSVGGWVGLGVICAFATLVAYKVFVVGNLQYLGITIIAGGGRSKSPHTPR